jgi:hypothetical protein
VAVMDSFESRVLDLPDFYFMGDDYRYRFEPEAKQRFLGLLQMRFNSAVSYNGRAFKWDTVIEQKTVELGRYLAGRNGRLDFSEPSPNLDRTPYHIRMRVLGLSPREAQRVGIRKSTLRNLRQRARAAESLRVYKPVQSRLQGIPISSIGVRTSRPRE